MSLENQPPEPKLISKDIYDHSLEEQGRRIDPKKAAEARKKISEYSQKYHPTEKKNNSDKMPW